MVDIIILNFNGEKDTSECILSLKRMTYKDFRVVLIDNGSTDGSGYRLKQKFPEIEFIRNEHNTGFAAGCNQGIKYSLQSASAEYCLLLNSDTIVGENLLSAMLEAAQADPAAGIIGAINYYYDKPDKVQMAAHTFSWLLGIEGIINAEPAGTIAVQSVTAACMMIKREVIEKTGFLEEKFFAYYEDSDYCLRAARHGYKVVAAKNAKIWHKLNAVLGSKNPQEFYIYTRNQPLFRLRNSPKIFLPGYFVVYFLKVSWRVLFYSVTCRPKSAGAILRGAFDFLRGRFGKAGLSKWIN